MSQLIICRKRFPKLILFCILAVTTISLSCTSDGKYDYRVLDPDEEENLIDIMLVSGNHQTGVVDQALPDSFVVYVSENYVPKPGWKVDFKIIEGEGTLLPASNTTDAKGYTGTTLTPTGLPGEIQVEATPYFADKSVIFTATSTAP